MLVFELRLHTIRMTSYSEYILTGGREKIVRAFVSVCVCGLSCLCS